MVRWRQIEWCAVGCEIRSAARSACAAAGGAGAAVADVGELVVISDHYILITFRIITTIVTTIEVTPIIIDITIIITTRSSIVHTSTTGMVDMIAALVLRIVSVATSTRVHVCIQRCIRGILVGQHRCIHERLGVDAIDICIHIYYITITVNTITITSIVAVAITNIVMITGAVSICARVVVDTAAALCTRHRHTSRRQFSPATVVADALTNAISATTIGVDTATITAITHAACSQPQCRYVPAVTAAATAARGAVDVGDASE